jgi:hypothetical protein
MYNSFHISGQPNNIINSIISAQGVSNYRDSAYGQKLDVLLISQCTFLLCTSATIQHCVDVQYKYVPMRSDSLLVQRGQVIGSSEAYKLPHGHDDSMNMRLAV